MYHKIKNPETNRYVSINSKKGKSIIYNYISILYGGAASFTYYRDTKNFDSDSEEQDDDSNIDTENITHLSEETPLSNAIKLINGHMIKSIEEDVFYFKPLSRKVDQEILRSVNKDDFIRADAHRTDCVPGTLFSLGFINETLYRQLSDTSRNTGLPINYVENIINAIKEKHLTTTITGSWQEIISSLLVNQSGSVMFAWFTPPPNPNSAGDIQMSHAVGIANKDGQPLLIDTQRIIDQPTLILCDGDDEIQKYFTTLYPGIDFNQISWTAFLYEESLSLDFSNLNLDRDTMEVEE